MLDQLNWAPEDARLNDELLAKAAAVHTIVPEGHRMGQPQVHSSTHTMPLFHAALPRSSPWS